MAENVEQQLVRYLSEAHGMEKQALLLLSRAQQIVGDDEVARIFAAHELQTQEHVRYVAERLEAHGESPSKLKDAVMQAAALGIGVAAQAAPDTPIRLATTAFAFENLEIAAYRLIGDLARRAGDHETVSVVERILDEEEAAAQLVAGTFERIVELALGEPGKSPIPPVTPLGKPSERTIAPGEHEGPQSFKDKAADDPVDQPPHIDTPADGHASPGQGYPADDIQPYGDRTGSAPDQVGATARDR
jgi:ferritin-like metal-binding protein YciE